MSVPFSNTHLRVPPGFGTILEGLAREVLRDQPEDIPKYAAKYFDALLKQREESGMDPAEWAAKLEDRFYNNYGFKATGQASPEKEPATEISVHKENSYKSKTGDESNHSTDTSNLSTTQPNVSEEVDLTVSTEEEEEEKIHGAKGKHISSVEKRFSEVDPFNRLKAADIQSDELCRTEKDKDQTINTLDNVESAANEKYSSSSPDQNVSQSELESTALLLFGGVSNVDVCAQDVGMTGDEGDDKKETAVDHKENVDSQGESNFEVEGPAEVSPHAGLAVVNVCATELGETERTRERATAENDTLAIKEERLKPQPEETLVQSSLSQFETPEGIRQEGKDQAEKTEEEEGTETETSCRETHETLAHIEAGIDGNAGPKEASLVEISFEDVPEAQQITEVGEKQPKEKGLVEVLKTNIIETELEKESKEVTAVATDQSISSTEHNDEHAMERIEKEFNPEGEEMESQQEASDIMKDKEDANEFNLNENDNDEKGEGVRNITSSYQPSTEVDKEKPEDETDHSTEVNEKISEDKFHLNEDSEKETKSNDPVFKYDERTDTVREDKEDMHTGGYSEMEDEDVNDRVAETHSSQVTQSDTTTAAMELKSENLEASSQNLPQENQRTLIESQPEDALEENEVTSNEAEKVIEERKIYSDVQEKSDEMFEEESISLTHIANEIAADQQGEEMPLGYEKHTREPEATCDKEECSRPQEEEDIMDIPLDDPEANRAAAKIQAGFRGHMTRKKMKPEDKAEGEEVSSTGDVLNGSQGDTETGGSGAVERDNTSVPEQ